jgi:hypothetical protein
MLLHDINSLECENKEALVGARKSVSLFKLLPSIVSRRYDAFRQGDMRLVRADRGS